MAPLAEIRLHDEGTMLRPVEPRDYEFLYWLSVSEFNSVRWRYRGQVPPYEVFVQQVNVDVLVHFIVENSSSGAREGYCVAYGADLRNRHCYVGTVVSPQAVGFGVGSTALRLLTDYLFRTWDFHKVFAEVTAFTLEPMREKMDRLAESGALRFVNEAVLSEYLYYNGEMWDMYIVSCSAQDWRSQQDGATTAL